MREDDPAGPDADSWVIPIPNSDAPAYAVMPWALFQRLRALAAGSPAAGPAPRTISNAATEESGFRLGDSPLPDADTERVVPLPMSAADDLWSKSMDSMPAFEDDDQEGGIPLDVLEKLLDGEHPLKVFRRYRSLTQKQLANLTGLNATYLSQIETRKRRGSTRVYRRLATALGVDIGDLIE